MREYPSLRFQKWRAVADRFSLTEINFEAAAEEAARLDAHLASTGQVTGPLHGIPISVKVSYDPRMSF